MRIRTVLLISLIFCCVAFGAFFRPDVRPGYGVTGIGWLSDYFTPFKGTNMDTPIYFMDSGVAGPTFLLMGGTHAREISSTTAALVFTENAIVTKGRVIVMPFSNISAVSIPDQMGSAPHFIMVETRSGPRFLAYGDRRTDPADQGEPDPVVFKHAQSDFTLNDGAEARNLNRQYPGLADGNSTQQLAYAIIEMIKAEKVDFNLDMHEAGTPDKYVDSSGNVRSGSSLAYTLVCHPDALEIGAVTIMEVEAFYGVSLKLEESNRAFRGLSHLEIRDATDSLSFLSETPNPGQDTWRENPDVMYDEAYPLKHRVALQLQIVLSLFNAYEMFMGETIEVIGVPTYDQMMREGLFEFLN
jgi:hypothetical protein